MPNVGLNVDLWIDDDPEYPVCVVCHEDVEDWEAVPVGVNRWRHSECQEAQR